MQQMIDPDTGNAGTLGMVFRSAIAGAIGVWAVDRLDWFLFSQEDPQARQLIDHVRPQELDPAHVAAQKAVTFMGTSLHPAQPYPAGVAIH